MCHRCRICLDDLTEHTVQYTTLCGHIYCLDCATFHFHRKPECPVCRTPQAFDQLIRLYPNYNPEEQNEKQERVGTIGIEEIETCIEALERTIDKVSAEDEYDIVHTLSLIRNHIRIASANEEPLDVLKFLRPLLHLLMSLSDKVERLAHAHKAEPVSDRKELEKAYKRAFQKLKQAKEQLAQQQKSHDESMQRERAFHAEREQELWDKIADVRRELDITRDTLDNTLTRMEEMANKLSQANINAVKSKKKYHALKQSVTAVKRNADLSDDSLMII